MMEVRNPRTGHVDYRIEPLDATSLGKLALDLRARQIAWAAKSPADRAELLRSMGAAIARHRDAIAAALTIDTGRRAISAIEVDGTVRTLDRWANIAPDLIARATGEPRPSATPGITVRTRLAPYPLVGVISPWNFPLTLALIDAIPALAAGCAVIVKPSEVTPRFIRPLMAALADVPDVPIAVIEGDGATGAGLIDQVDYIAFTGSVATGRKVAAAAAAAFIPASLELGGKDPMIVLASADPVWAARVALRASIVNTGQACSRSNAFMLRSKSLSRSWPRWSMGRNRCGSMPKISAWAISAPSSSGNRPRSSKRRLTMRLQKARRSIRAAKSKTSPAAYICAPLSSPASPRRWR